ncbi:MAG: hypothetical protein ACK5MK_12660 [Dysgonomonas sp.]
MMNKKSKNYFIKALLTILLAIGVFYGLKQILPDNIFRSNEKESSNSVIVDSLALQAIAADSLDTANDTILQTQQVAEIIPSSAHTDGYTNLHTFYSKLFQLEKSKKGKVRIAYFGDSMTDGDLIVKDIRERYQTYFGGNGVGFVGVTSLSASARYTITHQYSNNWITKSFLTPKSVPYPLGVDGQVSYLTQAQPSWLRLRTNDVPHLEDIKSAMLFFGSSSNQNGSISVSTDNNQIAQFTLKPVNVLNMQSLFKGSTKSLKIDFSNAQNIPFYGVNIDSDNGVYVDNFSMRGNSGLPLATLNKELMNSFDSALNYDLIIIHYGANLLGYKSKDYSWYEKKMYGAILHLKECFPHACFVIISTADRAIKIGNEMQTDPSVAPLLEAQHSYAAATNSCFINLFSLMGGAGSMASWVKEVPALANKDYTHFNTKGSAKVASYLYDELNGGYEKYKKLKNDGKIQ